MVLNKNNIGKIDVIILCGGFGSRLRNLISDKPKVLAKIGDRTFIDILVEYLLSYDLKNIILCTGYLSDHIKNHFNYNYINNEYSFNIQFSDEVKPLGTGGALKNAKSLILNNHFIVMNGDSICKVNFNDFYNFHIHKDAIVSIVLSKSYLDNLDRKDYGLVKLDNLQKIISFDEKISDIINKEELAINAGIYFMRKDIFSYMPERDNFSLEYDIFPKIVKLSSVYGFQTNSKIIDIGTPDRYKKALDILV